MNTNSTNANEVAPLSRSAAFWLQRAAIKAKMLPLISAATMSVVAQLEVIVADYVSKLVDKADLAEFDPAIFARACKLALAQRLGGSIERSMTEYGRSGVDVEPREILRQLCWPKEREALDELERTQP